MTGKIIQSIFSVCLIISGIPLLVNYPDNWWWGGSALTAGLGWLIQNITSMRDSSKKVTTFISNIRYIEDLPAPKSVTISTGIPLGVGGMEVKLNGTVIGNVNNNKTLAFSVAKRKNVLTFEKGGSCFFEVSDAGGEGSIQLKMGLAAPKAELVESSGIKPFVPETD
jgi:hypothetical protein